MESNDSNKLHLFVNFFFEKTLLQPFRYDASCAYCICLVNITVQPHRARVKQEQDCVQHCAQSAEGEAAATSHLLLSTPHPSDPVIPSALPASSLHINLPSSFDFSPASLCSLSFMRVLSAGREQSKER